MTDHRTQSCPSCGALNGADFARCIRCNAPLSTMAQSAEGLRRVIDGTSMRGTKLIVGLTLLIFAGQLSSTLARGEGLPIISGGNHVDAIRFGALLVSPDGSVPFEAFRLLSAVFVHFGLLHVGMNLFALVSLSRTVEPAVGTARYLIAYVVSGVFGFAVTAAYVMLTGAPPLMFTAGASGAVFGIMGVILGFLVRRRNPQWKHFALEAVLFSALFGFGMNAMNSGVVVNNSAHLGGLVCGFGLGFLYAGRRRSRSDLLVNVGAAIAVIACIASLVLTQVSPVTREAQRLSAREPSAQIQGDAPA